MACATQPYGKKCTTMQCMKTEVYSWRVSSHLNGKLAREARLKRVPISSVLDEAVRAWLEKNANEADETDRQRRLHIVGGGQLGALSGGNARRAETAREAIRERLRKRHER